MKKLILFAVFVFSLRAEVVYATFEVEAIKHANLSLQTQGVIREVFVDVGHRVKKGDILLVLESSEQKAQLDLSFTDLKLATSRFERSVAIKETISKDELEASEANFKRAEAVTNYHRAVVDNRVLRAPFDGVIAKRFVHEGDLIEKAQNGAFMIVDDSLSKLILSFDQRNLKRVKKDQLFSYKIENEVKTAVISQVYPTVDPSSRKAHAVVLVKELTHGIFGDGNIEIK